jgi:hypothetical protein
MSSLCYVEANTSTATFQGISLLVQGVPLFTGGTGHLHTTQAIVTPDHQGPLDTRIDYRGANVGPSQSADLIAVFNGVPALKALYWFKANTGSGTFTRIPVIHACSIVREASGHSFLIKFCNHTSHTVTGAFGLLFVPSTVGLNPSVIKELLSIEKAVVTIPSVLETVETSAGVCLSGDRFELPPAGFFTVRSTISDPGPAPATPNEVPIAIAIARIDTHDGKTDRAAVVAIMISGDEDAIQNPVYGSVDEPVPVDCKP